MDVSADWNKIKTEYITTDTSYRKLAQKYGVAESTIYARGGKERWVEQKEQHQSKTVAKILKADTKRKANRAENLQTAADLLLKKVISCVEAIDPEYMDTQALRHISATLKDLKEVMMIRSEKDMLEQDARIEKLRAEVQKDNDSNDVRIEMSDEVMDYCG